MLRVTPKKQSGLGRSTSRAVIWGLSLGTLAVSCAYDTSKGDRPDESNVAVAAAALGDAQLAGIPVPYNPSTGKVNWNGSYPLLLAADAVAECTLTQLVGVTEGATTDNDTFFSTLAFAMSASVCPTAPSAPAGYTAPEAFYWRWIEGRKIAGCNWDLATKMNRAMDFPYTITSGTSATYGLPTLATYQASSPAPAFSGAELNQARNKAQDQVHYAWLNLCVAEKLRQHLDNAQIALTSDQDLLQLQQYIRERATKAVFQYATLVKTMDDGASNVAITNPWFYASLISRWKSKEGNWPTKAAAFGRDIATAVEILAEAAESHTESLLRSSKAQSCYYQVSPPPGVWQCVSAPSAVQTFGQYTSTPASLSITGPLDSGLSGARYEALTAAYGQAAGIYPRAVTADMSAPEVASLLRLARAANALRITGANKTFDLSANGNTLLTSVETYTRQQDCIAKGDMTTTCYQIPSGTTFDQYVVRQRYNIQPMHARLVMQALIEHLYGQPGRDLYSPSAPWTYRFDTQEITAGLPNDFMDRLPGTHTYTGDFSSTSTSTLSIDPNARIRPLPTPIRQSQMWSYIPKVVIDYTLHPNEQGYGLRIDAGRYYRYGQLVDGLPLGSQSAFAYLRAVLSRASVNASAIISAAGSRLWSLLEQTTGTRQVVVRRFMTSVSSSSCSAWAYTATAGGNVTPTSCNVPAEVTNGSGQPYLDIRGNTRGTDPFTYLHVKTYNNPIGGPATTTAFSLGTETVDSSISSVTGEVFRSLTGNVTTPANALIELRLADSANTTTAHTLPLFHGKVDPVVSYSGAFSTPYIPTSTYQRTSTFAHFATYGGRLNRQIERAWTFQDDNWSKPKYDGLDLPTDWAPVGDASLNGGQVGQESYQYFLEAAKSAASDATAAIDKAFDTLAQEASDSFALQQSEDKGKTLNEFAEQSFCGAAALGASTSSATSCTPGMTNVVVTVPACPSGVTGVCASTQTNLARLLGVDATTTGLTLASDVASQVTQAVPNFDAYQGGELAGLLLRQWNAWQALQQALAGAVSAASAAESEVTAAVADKTASDTEYGATLVNLFTQYINFLVGNAQAQAEAMTLQTNWGQYGTMRDAAERDANLYCDSSTFTNATLAGWGFSAPELNVNVDPNNGNPSYEAKADKGWSESWSPGALVAAHDRCVDARNHRDDLLAQQQPLQDTLNANIAAVNARITANNFASYYTLPAQAYAALDRSKVAPARVQAAKDAGATVQSTQMQLVQHALGDLLETIVALNSGLNQARLAKARIDVDKNLEQQNIKTRFNLRRAFHSFDLWRARALAANARRLAVAARRAIESRFVVDLSALKSPEPFVDSPALWADDIYSADLKPPASVGRTMAPSSTTGVYSSKLTDYVNNLQLFVNGYSVDRPSASVRSDTEALQLPGPAAVTKDQAADGTVYQVRDVDSAGWSFYCPTSKTWVRNLQSATFNPTTWIISQVCGAPDWEPTRAKFTFWLDPWGRVGGSEAKTPFNSRYNARWRAFALNLVGSGIRDCSKASDPAACYAEPFIRYELRHIGPADVTDSDESWVSVNLPIGVIEGGKALASEEWLDPVSNGFQNAVVGNVARQELAGRPLGGVYELILELPPDVRAERIERIQVLTQSDYWVRQQ